MYFRRPVLDWKSQRQDEPCFMKVKSSQSLRNCSWPAAPTARPQPGLRGRPLALNTLIRTHRSQRLVYSEFFWGFFTIQSKGGQVGRGEVWWKRPCGLCFNLHCPAPGPSPSGHGGHRGKGQALWSMCVPMGLAAGAGLGLCPLPAAFLLHVGSSPSPHVCLTGCTALLQKAFEIVTKPLHGIDSPLFYLYLKLNQLQESELRHL